MTRKGKADGDLEGKEGKKIGELIGGRKLVLVEPRRGGGRYSTVRV